MKRIKYENNLKKINTFLQFLEIIFFEKKKAFFAHFLFCDFLEN
jgi:hypothetical protein